MAHQLKFLGILLLLGVHCVFSGDNVQIKIVEAPALSRFPSMPSNSQKQLTLRVKPANVSGPPHLRQLAGQCFSTQQKGYTYNVCPFHNVTQKEDRVSWTSFHGVLGVWREWLIENDSFVGMHFVRGERCGSKDREAKLMFNCSTLTQLYNVSEPSTCKYTIWLDTPLACFKGAMQVYHLLSPELLKQWDNLEGEYYHGELTFKGVTKQRRQILMEAGLLYDPERDREPEIKDSEPRAKGDNGEFELVPETEAVPMISPFTRCIQERLKLEKELEELREKIHDTVREFPSLAHKFKFIQNVSLTVSPRNTTNVSTASPHLPEDKPVNVSPHLPEDKPVNISPHLPEDKHVNAAPELPGDKPVNISRHLPGDKHANAAPELLGDKHVNVAPELPGDKHVNVAPEGNRNNPEQVNKPHRTVDSDHRGGHPDAGHGATEHKTEFEQQTNSEKVETQRTKQKVKRLEGQKTELLEGQNTDKQKPKQLYQEEQRANELILEALRMGDVEAGNRGAVPGERKGGPDAERGENEEDIGRQLADLLRGEEMRNLWKKREP